MHTLEEIQAQINELAPYRQEPKIAREINDLEQFAGYLVRKRFAGYIERTRLELSAKQGLWGRRAYQEELGIYDGAEERHREYVKAQKQKTTRPQQKTEYVNSAWFLLLPVLMLACIMITFWLLGS